jgi:Pyruvate/2-oxoacid:ferredoxin oxidoreductase delta subunit
VRSNDQGATVVPGLFFGGDVLTAAGTVAAAIGSGRRAAAQIRSYLLGKAHGSNPRVTDATAVRADDLNLAYLGAVPRVAASSRAPAERCTDFGEVVMGLGEEAARWEAGRCLSCGTCNACDNCFIFCPDAAVMRRPTGPYEFNLTACKGCGICVVECPRGALALVQESRSVTA